MRQREVVFKTRDFGLTLLFIYSLLFIYRVLLQERAALQTNYVLDRRGDLLERLYRPVYVF
jgi:hypothetical protein